MSEGRYILWPCAVCNLPTMHFGNALKVVCMDCEKREDDE